MFSNLKSGIVAAVLLGIILAFLATFAILPLSDHGTQISLFELLLSLASIVGFGLVATGLQSHLFPKNRSILVIMVMSVTFLIVSLLLRLISN